MTEDVKPASNQENTAPASASKTATDAKSQPIADKEDPSQSTISEGATAEESKSGASQPLAPPPKPSQQNAQGGDYFSGNHGSNNSHFSLEPNPFEQSFGNPSAETPGKFAGLPSVASLTSPAPLGPGGTPSLQDSLRSGPLSPAMLTGPTNQQSGYFDESFRNSFPTPNESSLRTGLTPGGGGSIFPAPSPNSQTIFNLQGGGATPGTLEFQKTAFSAAVRNRPEANSNQNMNQGQQHVKQEYQPAQQAQQFSNQPAESDAVNSLYMLANNGNRNNQFAMQQQQQAGMNASQLQQRMTNQPQDTSPTTQRANMQLSRPGGSSTGNGSEFGEEDENNKPATRTRGKKGAASAKTSQATNGRKKTEATPPKGSARKRSKGNNGAPQEVELEEDDDDGDGSSKDENDGNTTNKDGKKMNDEDKRKNFLERNRVAALKCRQRKKQWLANLQTKVEIFTSENDALTAQCSSLREEIINLKTLLLAHKDCPVSHSQGLAGNNMVQFMGNMDNNNPYGMNMNGGQMMGMQPNQGGMQRR